MQYSVASSLAMTELNALCDSDICVATAICRVGSEEGADVLMQLREDEDEEEDWGDGVVNDEQEAMQIDALPKLAAGTNAPWLGSGTCVYRQRVKISDPPGSDYGTPVELS